MKTIFKPICAISILMCFFNNYNSQAQISEKKYRAMELGEIREIKSQINGRDYELIINIPGSYYTDKTKSYPVFYFCDGYWDFPLIYSIYGSLIYDQRITECFLVGFSYKGENPNYDSLRRLDYLPTKIISTYNHDGGDAKTFLSVIKKEFIPFMEKNFRIDSTFRILGGSSAGGIFTLYSLFTEPGLFDAYIAISPAASWDNNWIFTYEQKFYDKVKELPVTLFMSGAEKEFKNFPEFLKGIKQFDQILKQHNYKNFNYQFRLIEDAYHSSTKAEGFTRGLQFSFSPL